MREDGKVAVILGLAIVVLLMCGLWGGYVLTWKQEKDKKKSARKMAEKESVEEAEVPVGRVWTAAVPVNVVPCVVYGSWESERTDFSGIDDTIVKAVVHDTEGRAVSSWEYESSGTFSLKVNSPGVLRFRFSNRDKGRDTPRKVRLRVKRKPADQKN